MGKNAGVKVITSTVGRRRFISARGKNSSCRMQGSTAGKARKNQNAGQDECDGLNRRVR